MMGKIKTLRELFEVELRYAYDCEQKLVKKGLPSMIESARSPELRQGLEAHLRETQNHVSRLEGIFTLIGSEPGTTSNSVLDEMTRAAKDSVSHIEDPAIRDAALIVNGNFVEHYEMALYGSLLAFAQQLGIQQAVSVLNETLQEEKAADAKLTQIAKTLNQQAARTVAA
jgi:ferritin-like metal-binding protein YciE